MKNRITGLVFFTLLFTFGYSKIIYINKQALDSYKTKADVINRFGLPDERKKSNGTEEWLYDGQAVEKHPKIDDSEKQRPVTANTNSAGENETAGVAYVTRFSQYRTFIKFTFDQNGRVVNWASEGLSLAKTKGLPLGTALIIVGLVGIAIEVIGTIAVHNVHIHN